MTETVWKKAYDLIAPEGAWIRFTANYDNCYCAGSAIAKAVTGDPFDLYNDDHPHLAPVLTKFADHVGARKERYSIIREDTIQIPPATRVYDWNDRDDRTKEEVLRALMELHEAEVASTT